MRFLRRKHPERPERDVVVLGRELADALQAEERHRLRVGDAPSALATVRYDGWSGAYDLHRFVESAVDEVVESFLRSYASSDAGAASATRGSLHPDDPYVLFTFARRATLAALQDRARPKIDAATVALTAIDQERVDWRDLGLHAELVAWALQHVGGDPAALAARLELAAPTTAKTLAEVASQRVLSPGMWQPIDTLFGTAPAHSFGRFEPDTDLVGLAFEMQEVVEDDTYRVTDITTGSDPLAWVRPDEDVRGALAAASASLHLSADLEPVLTPERPTRSSPSTWSSAWATRTPNSSLLLRPRHPPSKRSGSPPAASAASWSRAPS